MMHTNAPHAPDSTAWCTGATVMSMGFTGLPGGDPSKRCILYLFQGAVLDSAVKYGFACLGTVFWCAAIEGLSYARRKHVPKIVNPHLRLAVFMFVYAVQICLGYFAMLIAMTYSTFLIISVIIGLTIGHAYFRDPSLKEDDVTCCTRDAEDNETESNGSGSKAKHLTKV